MGSASEYYDEGPGAGGGGGGEAAASSLRLSEERYLRGERLRDEANELREDVRQLQDTVLARELQIQVTRMYFLIIRYR